MSQISGQISWRANAFRYYLVIFMYEKDVQKGNATKSEKSAHNIVGVEWMAEFSKLFGVLRIFFFLDTYCSKLWVNSGREGQREGTIKKPKMGFKLRGREAFLIEPYRGNCFSGRGRGRKRARLPT